MAIRNLKKIQFFSINNNAKYLGLEIVCEHGNYQYTYKDKEFNDFVCRVLEVYKREKDKNNILLVGNLTKKILSGEYIVKENKFNYKNDYNILHSREINETKFRDYLYLIVVNLSKLYNYEDIKIEKLIKTRFSYIVKCSNPDIQIPCLITNYNDKFINFDIDFINSYSCQIISDFDKEIISFTISPPMISPITDGTKEKLPGITFLLSLSVTGFFGVMASSVE